MRPSETMRSGAAFSAASTTGSGRLTLTLASLRGSSTRTCSQGVPACAAHAPAPLARARNAVALILATALLICGLLGLADPQLPYERQASEVLENTYDGGDAGP